MKKGLEKKNIVKFKKKPVFVISLVVLIVLVVGFLGWIYFYYFQTPEAQLNLGVEIESVVLSEDGQNLLVSLSGGSNDKEVVGVKFVFKDNAGNEYIYSTTEGALEISVPYETSWLDVFKKPKFEGVYNWKIPVEVIAGSGGLENIDTLSPVFEYEEDGKVVESPKLDTEKPAPVVVGGGSTGSTGNSGGPGTDDTTPSCGDGIQNQDEEGIDCGGVCEECVEPFVCLQEENCFYVSVSGAGVRDGTSGNEFNLSDAQSYANDNPGVEIMFLLGGGEYGAFVDTNPTERTAWVNWKANGDVTLTAIYYEVAGVNYKNIFASFEGFIVTPGIIKTAPGLKTVFLQNVGNVKLLDMTFVGIGYAHTGNMADLAGGIVLSASDNVEIDNCSIYGDAVAAGRNYEIGFEQGISGRNSNNITVINCDITEAEKGIVAWGNNWLISNNHLHNMDADAIILMYVANTTVENNNIYDVNPALVLDDTTGATYDDATGIITADLGNPYPDNTNYYIRLTRSDGSLVPSGITSYGEWYTIGSNTGNIITLNEPIGSGDYNDITRIEVVRGHHTDGIQLQDMSSPPGDYVEMGNVTISGNNISDIDRQGLHIWPYDWVRGLTMDNNLVYDTGTDVQLGHCLNIVFRNNTIEAKTQFREYSTVDIVTGNIMGIAQFYNTLDGVPVIENYNIVNEWGEGSDMIQDFIYGINSMALNDEQAFQNIFMNYSDNDFRPFMESVACPEGNNPLGLQSGEYIGAFECYLPAGCSDGDSDDYYGNSPTCFQGGDCNDGDININPEAVEICGNDVDEDCDGIEKVCAPVSENLTAWWKFENNLFDEVGDYDGTLGVEMIESYSDGQVGQALDFDGDGDYVDIGTKDLIGNQDELTISVWVKSLENDLLNDIGDEFIMYQGGSIDFRRGHWDDFYFSLVNETGQNSAVGASLAQYTDWHHLVVTYNGTNVVLYVDGNLEDLNNLSGKTGIGTTDLTISRSVDEWNGSIDEVMIYDRALSAEEVGEIYCAQGGDCGEVGTTYYLDIENPSCDDTNSGTNELPWCNINYAMSFESPVAPGDTVLIRAGTYRETVSIEKNGVDGSPIIIKAYPGETVIMDGSAILDNGWTQSSSDEAKLTVLGVTNPNYANIYKTIVSDSLLAVDPLVRGSEPMVFDGVTRKKIASGPTQTSSWGTDVTEFIVLEEETWNYSDGSSSSPDTECIPTVENSCGVYSYLIDSDYLTQADDYWNNGLVDIWTHAANNAVIRRKISDYNLVEHKLTFDSLLLERIWYGTDSDAFIIVNHPHVIDEEDEYYMVDNGDGTWTMYLYSFSIPEDISIIELERAFLSRADGNYISIEDITIRNYNTGIDVDANVGLTFNSFNIKNCTITNIGGHAIGFFDVDNSIIEDCDISYTNTGGRGILLAHGAGNSVRNNLIYNTSSTNIGFVNQTNSSITNNVLYGIIGLHGNAISVYSESKNTLIASNILYRSNLALKTMEDLIVYNNLIINDDTTPDVVGFMGGTLNVGDFYYFYNTLLGASSNMALDVRNTTDGFNYVANNILDGLSFYEEVDETFVWINPKVMTNNLYTSLFFLQKDKYGWVFGDGESEENDLNVIFTDFDNDDCTLRDGSSAIDAGIDVSSYLTQAKLDFPDYDFDVDIEGNPRDASPDIGAYEYGSLSSLSPFTVFIETIKQIFLGDVIGTSVTGMVVSASSDDDGSVDLIGFQDEIRVAGEQLFNELMGVDVSLKRISVGYVVKETGEEGGFDFVFDFWQGLKGVFGSGGVGLTGNVVSSGIVEESSNKTKEII